MSAKKHTSTVSTQNGFSLVELLVVLVLMGLVASLAFPRIQTALLAYERQSMEDTLYIFLRQQMAKASLTGVSFNIPMGRYFKLETNDGQDQINISYIDSASIDDYGMHYHTDQELFINTHGICTDTKVSLLFNEAHRELSLSQPFCKIDDTNAE